MKTVRTICFVAVVLFLCACPALGLTEFKDGLTHDIDYTINDTVWVDYQAPQVVTTVNLLPGGRISPYILKGFEQSRINISGGSVYDLVSFDSSQVNMSSGSIGCNLYICDSSQVNISGGSIGSHLYIYDSSQVNISGGSIIGSYLYIYDSSHVDISGGVTGDWLVLSDNSMIRIFGSDFAVDGQSAGYGELTSIFGGIPGDDPWRYLTGTLASGEPIINIAFQIGNNARIILATPEPATIALLGIGALFLRNRRK